MLPKNASQTKQAARRWTGQMALALISLGKVPMHPSCSPLPPLPPAPNHTTGTRQDLCARCRQNAAARAQGSEQCQRGDGRREREPFQGKGGQPTPAICHRGPGGDGGSPEHRRWG